MNIFVETATKAKEYDWYSEPGRPCSTRPRSIIADSSACLAFHAERNGGVWSASMHNLWLPGRQDSNNRRIRLSVRFDGLESEVQVRALALAYLALPLEETPSSTAARYCAELAECYGVAEDGAPLLQFDKMKQWAETVIARAAIKTPGSPAKYACFAEMNKDELSEIGEIKTHLQTYALREKDGLRILFDDSYVQGIEHDVDITITTSDTNSRIQYKPYKQEPVKPPPVPGPIVNGGGGKDIPPRSPSPQRWMLGAAAAIVMILVVVTMITMSSAEKSYPVLINGQRQLLNGKPLSIASSEIQLPDLKKDIAELEIPEAPHGSTIILNGKEIGKTPGKFMIPANGGKLQLLPPAK